MVSRTPSVTPRRLRAPALHRAARHVVAQLAEPVGADAYLAALNPRWGTRLRAVVERVTPLTADAAAIRLRPGMSWAGHDAGQFVTLGVDVDGVRHHRCYSITSPPPPPGTTAGHIDVTVQEVPDGTVSSHLVHRARPGEVVQLSQASGTFTLAAPRPGDRHLLLSGGSGVTPVLALLRTLVRDRPGADVVVIHHATGPDRCLHLDELRRLAAQPGVQLHLRWTRHDGDQHGGVPAGHLDAATLERICPDWHERSAHACGPTPLLSFAESHWAGHGLAVQLRTERFTPLTSPRRTGGEERTARASFGRSGVDVAADAGTPLLEVAERAGLTPPAGCRSGICHTCSTRLERGCVRDLRDGRHHDAGSFVQLCVSSAASDVVLDA